MPPLRHTVITPGPAERSPAADSCQRDPFAAVASVLRPHLGEPLARERAAAIVQARELLSAEGAALDEHDVATVIAVAAIERRALAAVPVSDELAESLAARVCLALEACR